MTRVQTAKKLPADVSQIMLLVVLALLPGVVVFVYQTGWGGLFNIFISIVAAIFFEAVALTLRQRNPMPAISDYSAVVTGLLIALCLPPLLPWWIPVLAVAAAILLAKHCYGGLGQNIFNPAMAGYAVVLISFPRDLSLWLTMPDAFNVSFTQAVQLTFNGGLSQSAQWDAITGATALDRTREMLQQAIPITDIKNQTQGLIGANHSEWLNLAYLAGGLGLIMTRTITWHIPAGVLMSLGCCSLLHMMLAADSATGPGFQLFSGAAMLCAFFIATDPVSAAASSRGRILYAAGIGVFIYLIRSFGSYPDSIAFAVLLMNCTVPMIDRIEPHLFGRSDSE